MLLSPVVVAGGYTLVVTHGLLIAAASLGAENQLWSTGLVLVAHGLGSFWTRH